MDRLPTTNPIELAKGDRLHIRDGRGRRIGVQRGLLWITQAGDPEDHFVARGDTLAIDRDGLTIVEAMHDSRVRLVPTGGAVARLATPAGLLVAVGSAVFLACAAVLPS